MSIFSRNKNKPQEPPQIIQQALKNMRIDPKQMNVQSGFGWHFQRKSGWVEVYLTQEDGGYLQVLSHIMYLPQANLLALYRHLLELNLQLTKASIGVHQDKVSVSNTRSLNGLDTDEAHSIIYNLANYADNLSQSLINEFSGRLYRQG